MRFLIRSAGVKFNAEVGGATIFICRRLWPLKLSSGQWYWTWLDGTQMVLESGRQNYRYVRHELFADGEAVWQAMIRLPLVFNSRWEEAVWACGERRFMHRYVPRRVTSWRGMFAVMPRHVLDSSDGRAPASWSYDCSHGGWQGVIRSSLDDECARAVFGIIVSFCLLEQSGDPT